jgi:hypothetical protein
LRIRKLFKEKEFYIFTNEDGNNFLFQMKDNKLIVPKGIKRIGAGVQVDNEKIGLQF